MAKDDSRLQRRVDGSLWLPVDAESPLSSATSDVEVVPERQRWMAAPAFSKGRYQAKPMQQRIGWLRALIILVHDAMRPRDEVAERLHDIEALILGGHNDAADQQIARLRADYPGDDMKARVLGLVSLNLYDRGNEGRAQYIHEFAVLCGTAHPAMTEIFGDTVADPSPRLCPPHLAGMWPASSCVQLISEPRKGRIMGFLSKLFGGASPEEKAAKAAAKAEARARREAEEQAEKSAEAEALLGRAMGLDPAQASLDARRKAAIKLVLKNQTEMGREAWLSISRDYPTELSDALEQVGVCYHLDKNYRAALENYEAAIRLGANADHLADNIAEARKGLAALG